MCFVSLCCSIFKDRFLSLPLGGTAYTVYHIPSALSIPFAKVFSGFFIFSNPYFLQGFLIADTQYITLSRICQYLFRKFFEFFRTLFRFLFGSLQRTCIISYSLAFVKRFFKLFLKLFSPLARRLSTRFAYGFPSASRSISYILPLVKSFFRHFSKFNIC